MKEILKHGKTFAKTKCEECGCEFWYTVADVFNSNSNAVLKVEGKSFRMQARSAVELPF